MQKNNSNPLFKIIKIKQSLSIATKISSLLFYLIFVFSLNLYGQSQNSKIDVEEMFNDNGRCGHSDSNNMHGDDPSKKMAFDLLYSQKIKDGIIKSNLNSVLHSLPVVVHIIHDGDILGSQNNPTDLEVTTEIEQTSQRFRHQQFNAPEFANPFYGADTEIEFCLTTTNPNNQFTSGVTRHYDPINAKNNATNLGTYVWDKELYLNIFIVNQIDEDDNVAGIYYGGNLDYLVIRGRTFWDGLLSHEIGHYLSLDHPFEGCANGDCTLDGDKVCDTPPKETAGFAGGTCEDPGDDCTTDEDDVSQNNPYRSVALGGMGNQPDMLSNYMDYTGSCWNSFTIGQKDRMQLFINENRLELSNNSGIACQEQSIPANDAGIFGVETGQDDICTQSFNPTVTIENYGSSNLTSVLIDIFINGSLATSEEWTGEISSGNSEIYTLSNTISYMGSTNNFILSASTSLPNGSLDGNSFNDTDYIDGIFVEGNCVNFDACEPFNPETNLGPGNSTALTSVIDIICTGSDVLICIEVQGDVSGNSERFNIIDESGAIQGLTIRKQDCAEPTEAFCFFAAGGEFQDWAIDGEISIILDPISTTINPMFCIVNQACLTITIAESSVIAFQDLDGDGYGDPTALVTDCTQLANTVSNSDDCDDTNPNINPVGIEIPNNGMDEDCDGNDLMTTSIHVIGEAELSIFPNPTTEIININVTGDLVYRITVYDLKGQLLHESFNSSLINLSNFSTGAYLLLIEDIDTTNKISEKIILMK